MSINLTAYQVLSREQFTQEFLPTMTPDGKYFTWEQVTEERPDDITATQVWTIYRQDDGSMIAFVRPSLGVDNILGYVVTVEDSPNMPLLAAHWWDSEERAHAELKKWATKIRTRGFRRSAPTKEWGAGWASKMLEDAFGPRQPLSVVSPMWDPAACWQVTDRAGLERLPIGTEMKDVHGLLLVKTGDTEYLSYPADGGPPMSCDTSELMGYYSGEKSAFLPATIVEREERLDQRVHDLEVGDVSNDERMDHLEGRITALEEMLRNSDGAAMHDSSRIDRLEKKVKKMHQRMGRIVGILEGLDRSTSGLTRIFEAFARRS